MTRPTLSFAVLLMFGTGSVVLAQDRDRERMPEAPQGVERGPDADAPRGNETRRPREDGPQADAPDRATTGSDPDRRSAGARGEGDGPSKADRKRAQRDEAPNDKGKARQKAGNDAKEVKGADKVRAESKESGKKRDAGVEGEKRESQAKSDDTREPAKPANEAADADKAKPADGGKQAADGDRKPAEDVKKADLSGDKGDRVRSALRDGKAKRRTDVHIDISIGTRAPRDWYFEPVPVAVIEVVPEYRGYVYAYVGDEYVICDPVTYEVVAVLPVSGSGATYASDGGAADHCSTSLTLNDDERAYIVRSIQMTDEVDVSDITVGWSVPGNIELRTFPEPIVSRSGKLASCRYFLADDQIAIVDPAEETVVLLIDHE